MCESVAKREERVPADPNPDKCLYTGLGISNGPLGEIGPQAFS